MLFKERSGAQCGTTVTVTVTVNVGRQSVRLLSVTLVTPQCNCGAHQRCEMEGE